jgi:hypothetical protein
VEQRHWTDEQLDDLISRRWTDEQLDDLAAAMRNGFDRIDRDEHHLRAKIAELRQWIVRLTIGMSLGFVILLIAILAHG